MSPQISPEEEAQRAQMAGEDMMNRTFAWIREMPTEGMALLRDMLTRAANDPSTAVYLLGRVEAHLEIRGVCMCGETHSFEEAEAMGLGHRASVMSQVPPIIKAPGNPSEELPGLMDAMRKGGGILLPAGEMEVTWMQPELDLASVRDGDPDPAENMIANAEAWGVRFVDPETLLGKVECIDCGNIYQTLADRMRREPGFAGCHFCHTKSRLG